MRPKKAVPCTNSEFTTLPFVEEKNVEICYDIGRKLEFIMLFSSAGATNCLFSVFCWVQMFRENSQARCKALQ